MRLKIRFLLLVLILLDYSATCLGQTEKDRDNSDEAKIIQNWKTLYFRTTASSIVAFKQRKFDSPFFCNELTPYKNGYIVHSIITSRGHGVEIRANFYYVDLTSKKINELTIPGADTIESIISDEAGMFICAFRKKREYEIISFKSGTEQDLSSTAPPQIKLDLDTAKWLKLGYHDGLLFVLTPASAYSFADGKWNLLTRFSLLQLRRGLPRYTGRLNILPTKNIVISKNDIWFLQEIVQERSSNLLRLDLKSGELSDYFLSIGYTDIYLKEVNEFLVLPDSSVLVAASRTMDEQMVINSGRSGTDVLIFQNAVKTKAEYVEPVAVTTAELWKNTLYMAGTDGLFRKIGDTIERLMSWENTHQEIKTKEGDLDYQFFPRAMRHLSDGNILVGGMWGGLYIADINKNTILCLDDIPDDKVRKLDIHQLYLK